MNKHYLELKHRSYQSPSEAKPSLLDMSCKRVRTKVRINKKDKKIWYLNNFCIYPQDVEETWNLPQELLLRTEQLPPAYDKKGFRDTEDRGEKKLFCLCKRFKILTSLRCMQSRKMRTSSRFPPVPVPRFLTSNEFLTGKLYEVVQLRGMLHENEIKGFSTGIVHRGKSQTSKRFQ